MVYILFLVSKSWPEFQAPYLTSLHASAITCLSHHCDLDTGDYLIKTKIINQLINQIINQLKIQKSYIN